MSNAQQLADRPRRTLDDVLADIDRHTAITYVVAYDPTDRHAIDAAQQRLDAARAADDANKQTSDGDGRYLTDPSTTDAVDAAKAALDAAVKAAESRSVKLTFQGHMGEAYDGILKGAEEYTMTELSAALGEAAFQSATIGGDPIDATWAQLRARLLTSGDVLAIGRQLIDANGKETALPFSPRLSENPGRDES